MASNKQVISENVNDDELLQIVKSMLGNDVEEWGVNLGRRQYIVIEVIENE